MKPESLHRYAIFVAAATAVLIAAGGLVTSTDSGLSVPDWPLSFGSLFPPMIGGIRFEHSHRMIAGVVGLLTLALSVFLFLFEKRGWLRGLGALAVVAVIAQAVLGGLTVIYLLPDWISITHACLAQTFFCLVSSIALFTSREWKEGGAASFRYAANLRRLLVVTTTFIYLQLIAGAVVRHMDRGIEVHFTLAFLIALHILFIILKTAREDSSRERLFSHAVLLGGFIVAQVFLGFASFIFTRMIQSDFPTVGEVLFTTAHQTLGALLLAGTVLLTLRAFRHLKASS